MKYRVLIVDDSPFMRKLIRSMIESDPEFHVVGAAKNGYEAVELVRSLQPDIVTLDVEMPGMSGLETLKHILKTYPVPVLMFSSHTDDGAGVTIAALELGAVDFVHKPAGIFAVEKSRDELLAKLKAAVKVRVSQLSESTHHFVIDDTPVAASARRSEPVSAQPVQKPKAGPKKTFDQLFAMGTSTGGPKALQTVLTALPEDFPHPILIVQHMPPKFTRSLAQRLNDLSKIHVMEAEDGQIIEGGVAYLAPGGFHMEAVYQEPRTYRITLNQNPPRNGHRPSVDVLFESVARLPHLRLHYILMTGMGNDGAKAMHAAKQKGAASTIAEAEETCVVFGMPKAAIALGGVDYILPLHKIAEKMVALSC